MRIIVMKFGMWVVKGNYWIFYVVYWFVNWLCNGIGVVEVEVVIYFYGMDNWFSRVFLL